MSCFRVNTPTTYPLQLFPPVIPKMFPVLNRNAQNRPLSCARAGGEPPGSPVRVYTETRHLVNSTPCQLANVSPPPPANRFGFEHMNQPTRYEDNLSANQLPNLFTSGTSLHVVTTSRQRVCSQTRKPVSRQTCQPAIWFTRQHTQELNMSSTFWCKHVNKLTTSKVKS